MKSLMTGALDQTSSFGVPSIRMAVAPAGIDVAVTDRAPVGSAPFAYAGATLHASINNSVAAVVILERIVSV